MSCSSPRSVTRARRKASCATRSPAILGASIAGGLNFPRWARHRAGARDGCCSLGRRATRGKSVQGPRRKGGVKNDCSIGVAHRSGWLLERCRNYRSGRMRDVAAWGPWVSAHPDVILTMGVKEILYRTKHLGWGSDTHLYRTIAEFGAAFPVQLESSGPRVIKQNRGNDGLGVWKVEQIATHTGAADTVRVLHAQRGSIPEDLPLQEFMARCEPYFAWGGCIIDQPFQPRLPDGMIRCYMGIDKVVGFGHQLIKALIPPPPEGPDSPAAQPGPRIMHGADAAPFQALRAKMETEWVPQMMEVLGIDVAALPIIWDADFLYGPQILSGGDSYVLCEINVSSCFAIPDQAPAAIARLVSKRLSNARAD